MITASATDIVKLPKYDTFVAVAQGKRKYEVCSDFAENPLLLSPELTTLLIVELVDAGGALRGKDL